MTNIKSSKEHVWFIFIATLPVFIYALLASVNNMFGFDMTGGLMGKREPLGAGGGVVFGAPIYIYYLFKAAKNYFGEAPIHMKITNEGVDILRPNALYLNYSDLSAIFCKDINSERFLVFENNEKIVLKIKLNFLNLTEEKVLGLFESYAGTLVSY